MDLLFCGLIKRLFLKKRTKQAKIPFKPSLRLIIRLWNNNKLFIFMVEKTRNPIISVFAMHEMRRFAFWTCTVMLFLLGTSCTLGKWPAIRLDKSELSFSSEGGEETITALNYSSLGISCAWEGMQIVNGKNEWINYIGRRYVFDGEIAYVIDGGWYHVIQPQGTDKQSSNQIFITVDPNPLSTPRHVTVQLECGDALSRLEINQK